MSEKRFTSGFGFNKDYDNPIRFITDEKNGKDYVLFAEITDLLNALNDENEQLQKKLMIVSAHLLSDECNLTESQIKNIIKEMENV